jgi:hypothetical protein
MSVTSILGLQGVIIRGQLVTANVVFTDDDSGFAALDSNQRILFDSTATATVNWDLQQLIEAGVPTIEWGAQTLNDAGAVPALDWNGRRLLDGAGNATLAWNATTTPLAPGPAGAVYGPTEQAMLNSMYDAIKLLFPNL